MTHFASVRITKFSDRSQLRAAGSHGLRRDGASRRRLRPGANLGAGLSYMPADARGIPGLSPRDVLAVFDAHLERNKIEPGQGDGALGFHAMVMVSPEWVAVSGADRHAGDNPRNRALCKQAIVWVESWAGKGAVYCARMDLDEEGAGVVDVFVAPVRKDGRTRKRERMRISTSRALTELRLKHRQRMAFVAMQTDWTDHCQKHLDPEIQRGRPKVETMVEHLEVEEYKDARTEVGHRLHAAVEEHEFAAGEFWALYERLQKLELMVAERKELEAIQEAGLAMRR